MRGTRFRITRAALMAACCSPFATALSQAPDGADSAFSPPARRDDPQRYETLWKNNPFVIATEITPNTQGLAQQFALTGVGYLGGDPVVFVRETSTSKYHTVSSRAPNDVGLELVSLEPASEMRDTTATVRLGSETGILHYEPSAALSAAAANPDAALGLPGNPHGGTVRSPSSGPNSNPAIRTPIPAPPTSAPGTPKPPDTTQPPASRILRRPAITNP